MRASLSFALAAILALPGCHLIDQSDFRPKSTQVAPPPIPSPESRPAFVTIDYEKPNPAFRPALAEAIRAVETRRPGSLYDVVSVVGSGADAAAGRLRAADVMTAIEANGVIPVRIQLGLALEPGRKIQQVRVYLR